MAGSLYQLRREMEATKEQAEALIALSHEHRFVLWEAVGVSLRGWALAKQERREEGITQIRQGIAATEATGTKLFQPGFFMLLTETCQEAGQPEEGLGALTEAFELASRTGIADYEPELHRLKGGLLLMQDDFDTGHAESCFQRAIEVARKQCAKSLELRATASLARLLAHLGRRDEARSMLAEIYNWFTEGFDTADLLDAKSLLDELSR
jgi:predicted ATPase